METVPLRKESTNADPDTYESLGIDKALQSIQIELVNNTSKLMEIDKHIKKDSKKVKEVQDDPAFL